jgi:hypothetical protein
MGGAGAVGGTGGAAQGGSLDLANGVVGDDPSFTVIDSMTGCLVSGAVARGGAGGSGGDDAAGGAGGLAQGGGIALDVLTHISHPKK